MRVTVLAQSGRRSPNNNITSGALTTRIMLFRDPVEPQEATTKQYIDNAISNINTGSVVSGTLPISRVPALTGDISHIQGSSVIDLNNVGILAGTYTRYTVNNQGRIVSASSLTEHDLPEFNWSKITTGIPTTLEEFGITNLLPLTGGTLTDFITTSFIPTNNLHAVTKQYVDSVIVNTQNIATGTYIQRPSSVTPSGFLRTNGGEVSRTTFSALFSVIGSSFDFTTMPGAGQPWSQQFDISLEPNTILGSWSTAGNLPGILGGSSVVATRNRVFLLGGRSTSGNAISTIFTAPINADGTLGVWVEAGNLPSVLIYSSVIVTRNRVFLLGGSTAWPNSVSTIFTATINADGTLGAWVEAGNLPSGLSSSSVVVTRNRVFLLGGLSGVPISTIHTTTINSDGTLGVWATAGNIPSVLYAYSVAVTRNRVFLFGGFDNVSPLSTIFTATINADGTLGAWSAAGNLPSNLAGSSVIVTRDRVFVLGGSVSWPTASSTVQTAVINADGTLGVWSTVGNFPVAVSHFSAIVTSNRVFLLGGWNGSIYISTIQTATINAGLNDYSPFYDGTMVPTDLTNFRLPDTTLTDPPGLFTFIRV